MICSFIAMKCEGFSMITDLVNYLNNNLLIAHYYGFDISLPLPTYWTFDHFLKTLIMTFFSTLCILRLFPSLGTVLLATSFIGPDSTPVSANTSQNNPKPFPAGKYQPKADNDCTLGVHTSSNQLNEKKYDFS